ncbi:MAG: mechanosensitive ion channel family protein [Bryobacteraceae bacterium]|jgi:small-conductance mechanosensitive channel
MPTLLHPLAIHPRLWIEPAAVFLATLAIAYAVRRIFFGALHSWIRRTNSRAGLALQAALRGPSHIWNLILALHFAIQSSALPFPFTDRVTEVLQVLFIVSLTLMFMRIAGDLVRQLGEEIPGSTPATTLTQNLAQVVVVILGAMVALRVIGIEITPLLTALGVGGLAVALALQDTLSNLFGGIYVSMAGQVRLGDYIKLNTGEEGYVTDIGWRSTILRTLGGNMIIVPNAKLAQAIVTNYYLPQKAMSASLQVGVSYSSDIDLVERVLLEIGKQAASEVPGMLADPAPSVTLDPGFGDWSLNFQLGFQVAEFSNQTSVRNELRKRILRRFREEGIVIPFPTRSIFTTESPGHGN